MFSFSPIFFTFKKKKHSFFFCSFARSLPQKAGFFYFSSFSYNTKEKKIQNTTNAEQQKTTTKKPVKLL